MLHVHLHEACMYDPAQQETVIWYDFSLSTKHVCCPNSRNAALMPAADETGHEANQVCGDDCLTVSNIVDPF